ncbi:hypothetical protein [Streptomyces sp. NPDC021212]|uniref:hypothetical protein n=1 Tax=Streptomyces sp. NPDC021212 TaxID=3365118 RepID=UPI0037A00A2C
MRNDHGMFRYAFLMTTSAVADAPKAAAILFDVTVFDVAFSDATAAAAAAIAMALAAAAVAVTVGPFDGARS